MPILRYSLACCAILVAGVVHDADAAFQVLDWNIASGTQFFSVPFVQDFERNQIVTNPWTGTLQGVVGLNRSRSIHDYGWSIETPHGLFNTSFLHEIRTPDIRTLYDGAFRFFVSTDVTIHLDSLITYSHTPGDNSVIDYFLAIGAPGQPALYRREFRGGNGHGDPASGTFAVDETFTLMAGNEYHLNSWIICSNTADSLPTGVMNLSGALNWSITPEPSTLSLLMPAALILLLRRRPESPPRSQISNA